MCDTCGCGQPEEEVTIRKPHETMEEHHHHDHDHDHPHGHDHKPERVLQVEQDILSENNLLAERNRGYMEAKGILALNLVSSPGSGKTTMLEKTVASLKEQLNISVIEGDQQSLRDAERIDAAGVPVVQVNTGTGCHLDASMVRRAVDELLLEQDSVLFIENVGNLVCPALFDLGESARVVIVSVTEGEDKPQKYPFMFNSSDTCVINKIDLLPYVDFDMERLKEYARQANPDLIFLELSAKTGEGLEKWYEWLQMEINKLREAA